MLTTEYIEELNLKVFQPEGSYRYNEDSILLAKFIRNIKAGSKVADLGAGVGIILLILARRFDSAFFYPVEIQEEIFNILKKNIEENGLSSRFKALNLDFRLLPDSFNQVFDVVVSNPPYRKRGEGRVSKDIKRAISRHETYGGIEELLQVASRILKDRGKIYLSFLPERLVDLIYVMRDVRLEPKKILPIYPKRDKEANLILVEGVKRGGKGFFILPPFFRRDNFSSQP